MIQKSVQDMAKIKRGFCGSPPWLRPIAFFAYAFVIVLGLIVAIVWRRQVLQRKAERGLQLATADKLAAVGQLAAGMAHDFNNQLMSD
ncbi:MAG: hypothetical protein ACI9UK_002007 [Candidatus Krumholzibacteriia bacterium]